MELSIELKSYNSITQGEKTEIEEFISKAIELHKQNSSQLNKFVMNSVITLTASEARANELASQGFFKRAWGSITGKNQKIRADIDRNIAKSQYASQQMLQKLAEQNLITFDMVTAVNNKLNALVVELEEEINKIYHVLIMFFKQTRSDIVQLEARLDKVERNVELLYWNATIEYQLYEGTEYSQLTNVEKIVCLTNDFFHRTKGSWTTPDLMLLKSTLVELGLPVKTSISTKSFYNYLVDKPMLIDRLFEGISLEGLITVMPYEVPFLKGVEKAIKLNEEEKYIVDTVTEQLDLADVNYNKRDIALSIVSHYLMNNAYMNPETKVNMFDFVIGLLVDLKTISASTTMAEEVDLLDVDEENNSEQSFNYGDIVKTNRYVIYSNKVYYYDQVHGNFYRLNLDGSEKTIISNNTVYNFVIQNNKIYFDSNNKTPDNNIYRMDLEGNNVELIQSESALWAIDNDYIIFTKSHKYWGEYSKEYLFFQHPYVRKIRSNSQSAVSLPCCKDQSDGVHSLYANNAWLYYIYLAKLYRIKYNGTSKQCLTKELISGYKIKDNWIYCKKTTDGGLLRVKWTGQKKKLI